MTDRTGQVAVIFASHRRADGDDDYAAAAAAMDRLAATQPGYRGVDSARGVDGFGITVSWWVDEAAAIAWRAHPEHEAIRERGRAQWYDAYEVAVAAVGRSYRWERDAAAGMTPLRRGSEDASPSEAEVRSGKPC